MTGLTGAWGNRAAAVAARQLWWRRWRRFVLTVPAHGSFVTSILPFAQFNACSFGRLGSNSRQSSDGSDGGAGAGGAGRDARGDHGGGAAAGPAFFGVGGGGFDLAGFGGGLPGRASGGAHPGASSGPRLGLAALRFLVRSGQSSS